MFDTIRLFSLMLILLPVVAQSLDQNSLETSWRQAIQRNDTDLIRYQIDHIGDIDLPSGNGKTALMAAAFKGDRGLVKALLLAGAEVNLTNNLQGSALMYAVAHGDMLTIRLLLQNGARINHQSSNGWSALMMAVAKRHDDVIALLFESGADANLADVYGWTPLMRAAYEGYIRLVDLLLQHNDVDIERRNDHGQTALHLAVINRQTEAIKLLLDKGAHQKPDFAGRTPRSIAETIGNDQLLRLLRQHN